MNPRLILPLTLAAAAYAAAGTSTLQAETSLRPARVKVKERVRKQRGVRLRQSVPDAVFRVDDDEWSVHVPGMPKLVGDAESRRARHRLTISADELVSWLAESGAFASDVTVETASLRGFGRRRVRGGVSMDLRVVAKGTVADELGSTPWRGRLRIRSGAVRSQFTSAVVSSEATAISAGKGALVEIGSDLFGETSNVTVERLRRPAADQPDRMELVSQLLRVAVPLSAVSESESASLTITIPDAVELDGGPGKLLKSPGEVLNSIRVVVHDRVTETVRSTSQFYSQASDSIRLTGEQLVALAKSGYKVGEFFREGIDLTLELAQFVVYREGATGFPVETSIFQYLPGERPQYVSRTDGGALPGDRPALVFVHGWQSLSGALNFFRGPDDEFSAECVLADCPGNLPHRETWDRFLEYSTRAGEQGHARSRAVLDTFDLFTVRYDSDRSVVHNAADLAALLRRKFPGRRVVLVAHSMGGLVCNAVAQMELGIDELPRGAGPDLEIARIVTLGTPFHGSPLIQEFHARAADSTRRCVLPMFGPHTSSLLLRTDGTLDLSWDGFDYDPDVAGSLAPLDSLSPRAATLRRLVQPEMLRRLDLRTFSGLLSESDGWGALALNRAGGECLLDYSSATSRIPAYVSDSIVPESSAHCWQFEDGEYSAGVQQVQRVVRSLSHLDLTNGGRDESTRDAFFDSVLDQVLDGFVPATEVVMIDDEFTSEDLDNSVWTSRGHDVRQQDGQLHVETNATDRGGILESVPLQVDPRALIVVERRFTTTHGASNYRGQLWLDFGLPEDADRPARGVAYSRYGFSGGPDCSSNSFYLHGSAEAARCPEVGSGAVHTDSMWNTWLDERLEFDPVTGQLSWWLDDEFVGSTTSPPLDPEVPHTVRVIVSSWGWYTGHSQSMEYISVRKVSR